MGTSLLKPTVLARCKHGYTKHEKRWISTQCPRPSASLALGCSTALCACCGYCASVGSMYSYQTDTKDEFEHTQGTSHPTRTELRMFVCTKKSEFVHKSYDSRSASVFSPLCEARAGTETSFLLCTAMVCTVMCINRGTHLCHASASNWQLRSCECCHLEASTFRMRAEDDTLNQDS